MKKLILTITSISPVPVTPFPDTLSRNFDALSPTQQKRLSESHVIIVGCGGLGGFVAEELARIGAGQLTLFDPDTFSRSNCNRQLNALKTTLDHNKAMVTAERIKEMGTGCKAIPYPSDFRDEMLTIKEPIDIVIDCLDSIGARYQLAEYCNRLNVPLVHGAVASWYGQVGVQLPGFHLPSVLFPGKKDYKEDATPPSVLSFTVATVASLQVVEAIKVLLGLPSQLHNNWMQIDLKHNTFDIMEKP